MLTTSHDMEFEKKTHSPMMIFLSHNTIQKQESIVF